MNVLDVNVTELIDNSRLNPFHIRVIGLCACLLFFEGFDFYAISYVAPALGQALAISKLMLGPIFSAGQLGLMLGALVLGIAGDRWGRKRVFILCGLVFGVASLATAFTTSYLWLLLCRLIAGLGMGGAGPIAITIVSDYSSEASARGADDGDVHRILIWRRFCRCRQCLFPALWLADRVLRRGRDTDIAFTRADPGLTRISELLGLARNS